MKKTFKRYFVPNFRNNFRPHLLRKRTLTLFVAFFLVLEIAVIAQVFFVFKLTDFLAAVLPGALVTLTNEERTGASLDSLTTSPVLEQAAQLKANDMAAKGYFAHTSPEGIEPWYWLEQAGYNYIFAGENLAVNFTESKDVSDAWMNSESHRKNIVSEKYTEIGIATAEGVYKGRKTTFVVQFFGRPVAVVPQQNPILVEQQPVPAKTPVKSAPAPEVLPVEIEQETVAVADSPQSMPVTVSAGPEAQGQESFWKNALSKISTSPRLYANFIIGVMVGLLLAVLFVSVIVKINVQHPKMIAASIAVAILGIGLITINNSILRGNTEIPAESSTASSFMAF